MKKIITLALICFATSITFAQKDSTKSKTTGYVCVGLSVTNSNDFNVSSYSAIEGGVMRDNFSIGLAFGRGSLKGIGKSDDVIENYFYEVRTYVSHPVGDFSGSLILGYGGYVNTPHMFIEYGTGMTYNKGKMGYGISYTNWDQVNYLTPCITLNF